MAAARAVLFSQLVNDPGGKRGYGKYKGQTKEDAQKERERLFDIIRDLIKWDNTNNEEVLERAKVEIQKSWIETCEITGDDPKKMPSFLDPFAGGGTIPLEAQRLGLEAHASDLNPIAVMINKAMIEIPPNFIDRKPMGPEIKGPKQKKTHKSDWSGVRGLAEDIRRYGHWMQKKAWDEIGHLYPDITIPKEFGSGKTTPIAWLWARTVESPSPAYKGVHVPLVSSFVILNTKTNKAWIEPKVDGDKYSFVIHQGAYNGDPKWKKGTKAGRGIFKCLLSESPIELSYVKQEGLRGNIKRKLLAVLIESNGKRFFINPTGENESALKKFIPNWKPTEKLSTHPQYMGPPRYGLKEVGDLFTPQQLLAFNTFSELLKEVYQLISKQADEDYARAIITYLAFTIDKCTDYWSTVATWMPRGTVGHVFSTHALPMTWDFPEINPFADFHCSWGKAVEWVAKQVENNKYFDVKKRDINTGRCKVGRFP